MKIKMTAIMAGPTGVFDKGTIREVPTEVGARLVADGYAEDITPPAVERATLANLEKRLDRMKKEELQALAKQLGVKLEGNETNKQIIDLLNKAEDDR